MKKTILFIAVVTAFFGCSKKGSSNPTPTNSVTIAGKWFITADTAREYQNAILIAIDTTSYNHTDYIQFNDDNSGSISSLGLVKSFTYTKSGENLTITTPTYANDGTPEAPLVQTAVIKALTASGLRFELTTTFTYSATNTYRVISDESFTK
jgi:hypothetical protein